MRKYLFIGAAWLATLGVAFAGGFYITRADIGRIRADYEHRIEQSERARAELDGLVRQSLDGAGRVRRGLEQAVSDAQRAKDTIARIRVLALAISLAVTDLDGIARSGTGTSEKSP